MKNKLIIIIPLIILIIISVITVIIIGFRKMDNDMNKNSTPTLNEEQKNPLLDKGFNESEIELVSSTLTEEQIELVLNDTYEKTALISLIKEKYFINENLDRYFNYYNKSSKTISDIVKDVNSNIDYEFYQDEESSDTSKGILMIANKHYKLDTNFEGLDIVQMDYKYSYYQTTYKLNKEAYEHFEQMWNDAKKEGLDFGVYSGYRSYNTQTTLYNRYVSNDGQALADTYSARPGSSEHQTGLAVDLKSRTKNTDYFETTAEFDWLQENSYKYGFILRYELGQEYITGYQYEPWHYRYCGIECATYIHENNITFEEYYEYYIKDKNE